MDLIDLNDNEEELLEDLQYIIMKNRKVNDAEVCAVLNNLLCCYSVDHRDKE